MYIDISQMQRKHANNNLNSWLTKRDSEADVSSISPSSEGIENLWVVCGLYTERWSYAIDGLQPFLRDSNNKDLVGHVG